MDKKDTCYKCEDRTLGCHQNCEKYKAYKKKYNDIRTERKKEKNLDTAIVKNIERFRKTTK